MKVLLFDAMVFVAGAVVGVLACCHFDMCSKCCKPCCPIVKPCCPDCPDCPDCHPQDKK